MRKGKYIDYTILMACLSKMPEPQQNKDERQVNGFIDTAIPEEFQREKPVRNFELEPA